MRRTKLETCGSRLSPHHPISQTCYGRSDRPFRPRSASKSSFRNPSGPAPSSRAVCAPRYSSPSPSWPLSRSSIVAAAPSPLSCHPPMTPTSSTTYRVSQNQKTAATRHASTGGTIARNSCRSSIPTCPSPRAARAATYTLPTRPAVRPLVSPFSLSNRV
jgi:hypothetical protein